MIQDATTQVQESRHEASASAAASPASSPAPADESLFAARDAATLPPPKAAAEPGKPAAVRVGPERGMWVWHFECYADPQERDRLIAFSKEQGIGRLLVQIHYEADRSSPEPDKKLAVRGADALGELVQKAGESGIAVEALDGDPSWALPSEQAGFWPKLDAILAWNQQQPANRKLAGVHLDVEPYTLKQFKSEEKPAVMRGYLDLLSESARRIKAQDVSMVLAADIPFWYDSREEKEADNHFFEYNGKKQPLSRHVQDICDYVAVMSYRQKAVGGNSISSTSEGEIAYAESIGKRAFPSVEMSEVSDTPTITFYGTDPALFRERFDELLGALNGRKGFGGVMIHHYKSFRTYLETEKPKEAS